MAGFKSEDREELHAAMLAMMAKGVRLGQMVLDLNAEGFRTPKGKLLNVAFLKHQIDYYRLDDKVKAVTEKLAGGNAPRPTTIETQFLLGVLDAKNFSDSQKLNIIAGACRA